MKKIIFLAGFILGISSTQAQIVDSNFANGNAALINGNFDKAVKYFDKVIQNDPNNERALILRSQAFYSLKAYKLVIKDCETILSIHPEIDTEEDYIALWNMGIAFNSLRQFAKAREILNVAKTIHPEDVKLYENVGYSYLSENKLDSALIEFNMMVSIDSNSEKGYYGIGKVYYLQGNLDKAIEAYDKAININPNYIVAYQNRGAAKLDKNDISGCCQDWNMCYQLGLTQIKPYLEEICE